MVPVSMPAKPVRRTIWVDVEDLFQYALANPRPSGIQRLVFEILRVLPDRAARQPGAPRIAFVRHDDGPDLLREVPFTEVAVLFERKQQNGLFTGYTGNYIKVGVDSDEPLSNRIIDVTITGVTDDNIAVGRIHHPLAPPE